MGDVHPPWSTSVHQNFDTGHEEETLIITSNYTWVADRASLVHRTFLHLCICLRKVHRCGKVCEILLRERVHVVTFAVDVCLVVTIEQTSEGSRSGLLAKCFLGSLGYQGQKTTV